MPFSITAALLSDVQLPGVLGVLAQERAAGPLRPGRVYAARCGNPQCVLADHVVERRRRDHLRRVAPPLDVAVRARIAAVKRRDAKLTLDQAREIRARPEPANVIAPEYGVSATTIRRIRRGESWPDLCNPWAGLLAR